MLLIHVKKKETYVGIMVFVCGTVPSFSLKLLLIFFIRTLHRHYIVYGTLHQIFWVPSHEFHALNKIFHGLSYVWIICLSIHNIKCNSSSLNVVILTKLGLIAHLRISQMSLKSMLYPWFFQTSLIFKFFSYTWKLSLWWEDIQNLQNFVTFTFCVLWPLIHIFCF